MADVYARLEMEFDGFLNGWTDVTDDVVIEEGIYWDRGLPGDTVQACVAKVGLASWSMHNSADALTGALAGRYTFGHTNQRTGFAQNVGVRISVVVDGEAYVVWTGRLRKADSASGMAGARISKCVAADYMYQCERKSLAALSIERDILDSEAFSAIVAAMPIQPRALSVGTGFDTLPYVFHTLKTEKAKASSEFQKLSQTTLAKIFVKKDGTLTYEPRSVRARNITTNFLTVTEDDIEPDGLDVADDRDDVINRVQVTLHPPTVEGEEVVLFSLPRVVPIAAGQDLPLRGLYTEPGQRAFRAGGLDMLEPDAYLGDYSANTASDGSGLDVTDQVTIETTFTATSVLFVISAPINCYLLNLQVRGIGVFDNSNAVIQHSDDNSIDDVGENPLELDLKYASDVAYGDEVARYLLSLAQQNAKRVKSVTFLLNGLSNDRASLFANREISDRIGFEDYMTSLPTSTASGFNINSISGSSLNGEVRVRWVMAPSDSTRYWLLEIPGYSELSITTRLGFSLIVGHTDVDHGDDHDDGAHTDVAHGDTHGDIAHADAAHTDSAHGDIAHSDVAHSDTAHSDVAHSDGQNVVSFDDSHGDSPHRDSHNDDPGIHGDGIHTDYDFVTPNQHVDGYYPGTHGDSHTDDAHADGHVDIPHGDSHIDSPHGDTAHGDVNHSDSHVDTGHADAAHGDTAHTDDHTDSLHSDVPHDDAHDDIEHGDQN